MVQNSFKIIIILYLTVTLIIIQCLHADKSFGYFIFPFIPHMENFLVGWNLVVLRSRTLALNWKTSFYCLILTLRGKYIIIIWIWFIICNIMMKYVYNKILIIIWIYYNILFEHVNFILSWTYTSRQFYPYCNPL